MGFTVRPTNVRVQCMNTISMAWQGNKAEHVVRHTTNAASYLDEAQRAMKLSMSNLDAMDAEIAQLLNTPLPALDFGRAFVPTLLGPAPTEQGRSLTTWESKADAITQLYFADHNEAITGTAWGAVNAVNEYERGGAGTRGQERWRASSRPAHGNYTPHEGRTTPGASLTHLVAGGPQATAVG
jgi:hypothetical protein